MLDSKALKCCDTVARNKSVAAFCYKVELNRKEQCRVNHSSTLSKAEAPREGRKDNTLA